MQELRQVGIAIDRYFPDWKKNAAVNLVSKLHVLNQTELLVLFQHKDELNLQI